MSLFGRNNNTFVRVAKKKMIPDGVWMKCPDCEKPSYTKEVENNLNICPKCGYHMTLSARKRIERTKKIMDNTRRLGVAIVQTHIGFVPENIDVDRKAVIMRKCLEEVGEYGQKTGVILATETLPRTASGKIDRGAVIQWAKGRL